MIVQVEDERQVRAFGNTFQNEPSEDEPEGFARCRGR